MRKPTQIQARELKISPNSESRDRGQFMSLRSILIKLTEDVLGIGSGHSFYYGGNSSGSAGWGKGISSEFL